MHINIFLFGESFQQTMFLKVLVCLVSTVSLPSAPWSLLIKKHRKQSNEGFEVEIIQLVYTIKEYKLEDSMVFYLHFSFFAY